MGNIDLSFHSFQGFVYGDFPFFELVEDVAFGRGRIDVDEGEERGDGVEPVFDRGVADPELGLHFLDRAMAADEGRDE
jgi:hypothetical protein